MTAPQIIMIGYLALGMFAYAVLHGQARTGTHHIGMGWLSEAALFGLLWWGGFWE